MIILEPHDRWDVSSDANFHRSKNWLDTLRSERIKEICVLCSSKYYYSIGKNPDELIQLKIDNFRNVNTAKEFQTELRMKKVGIAVTPILAIL
ncbi:MAG TPA: hypothetical protein VK253_06265, partial [Candidatus Binatia bacterium]|nr:hypothetical protein [Candidatus Binatia bacterium]